MDGAFCCSILFILLQIFHCIFAALNNKLIERNILGLGNGFHFFNQFFRHSEGFIYIFRLFYFKQFNHLCIYFTKLSTCNIHT